MKEIKGEVMKSKSTLSTHEKIQFNDECQELIEALLKFGGKAYPKTGNFIIMVGGVRNGKAFVIDSLLGTESIVLDSEKLIKLSFAASKFKNTIKNKYGIDILKDSFSMNPDYISILNQVIKEQNLDSSKEERLFKAIASGHPDRKPNIIFDLTLKDITKLTNLVFSAVSILGYLRENIHLVWTLNTLDTVLNQNKDLHQDKEFREDILIATYRGILFTMSCLLKRGNEMKKMLDGEIYIAFNQTKLESTKALVKETDKYYKDIHYIRLKQRKKNLANFSEIEDRIIDKIRPYLPDNNLVAVWSK